MSLKRMQIRKSMKDIIKGKTLVGDQVFTNASIPTWVEDLPVILIYNRSESVDLFGTAPREWEHKSQIAVEIIANGREDASLEDGCEPVADILDDIGEKIVCELSKDSTLNDTVDEFNLVTMEFNYEGDGNKPIGTHILVFEAVFYTGFPQSFDKVQGASDFKTATVDYKVGHHDDDPDSITEATDNVVIPV